MSLRNASCVGACVLTNARDDDAQEEALERLVNRVPEVTLVFWIYWLAVVFITVVGTLGGDPLHVLAWHFRWGSVVRAMADGGLGLGTIPVSAVFLLIIVILVVHLTREEKKLARANPLP